MNQLSSFFIILIALTSFTVDCNSIPELPQRGICAHRGASFTHPENTLAAFKEAIRLGAHMIEFDVQMLKDGELIILHNETVDHTTNGKGKAAELTFVELKALDAGEWKGAKFKGEKIPTLSETLDMMPKNIWLNVHIRGGPEIGIKAAKIILEKKREHQTFLACKSETVKAVRNIDKKIMVCNMDRRSNPQQYVDETIAMKADFIQLTENSDAILLELTQQLKQHQIRINYYGTNSQEKLQQLYNHGIDFPLVDNVEPMLEAANALGIPPVIPQF